MALAQPLLDLLARNAPFLVAHRASGPDIVLLMGALLLAPPTLAWCSIELLARLRPGGERAGLAAAVAFFVAVGVLPLAKRVPGLPALFQIALALGLGAFSAFAWSRLAVVRRFATVLAIAPLVFAVAFLTDDSVRKLTAGSGSESAAAKIPDGSPPVVMVVFDELPTISLLDGQGRIDAARYPAFGRLAREATWFRNASGVHYHTAHAVPPLVTGRYPELGLLPIASDHPGNLFALLRDGYELEVHETLTRLRPRPPAGGFAERIGPLVRDVGVVALHVFLPEPMTRGLPRVDQSWKGFSDAGPALGSGLGAERRGMTDERRAKLFGDRHGAFQRFLDSIEPHRGPSLYFLHILLPHRPWEYLPSGRRYAPTRDLGVRGGPWGPQEWWSVDAYHKHLLQLEYTDARLGDLLARLDALGLYDRALLVVTADHGVGFWPGDPRRDPRTPHPSDSLAVPLFVKVPGQRTGSVSERNVEAVDVLPTIAGVLGVEIPWEIDGCSALSDHCAPRATKTMYTEEGTRLRFEPVLDLEGESLSRKLRLFGDGAPVRGASAWGHHRGLVGRRVEDLTVEPRPVGRVEIARVAFDHARAAPRGWAAVRILGSLRSRRETRDRVDFAIVTDGVVRAVTVGERAGGEVVFSAFVPESEAGTEVDVYTVVGDPDRPALRRARTVYGEP